MVSVLPFGFALPVVQAAQESGRVLQLAPPSRRGSYGFLQLRAVPDLDGVLVEVTDGGRLVADDCTQFLDTATDGVQLSKCRGGR